MEKNLIYEKYIEFRFQSKSSGLIYDFKFFSNSKSQKQFLSPEKNARVVKLDIFYEKTFYVYQPNYD